MIMYEYVREDMNIQWIKNINEDDEERKVNGKWTNKNEKKR